MISMALLRKAGRSKTITPAIKGVVEPLLTALVPYMTQMAKSVDEETWDDNLGNPLSMQLAGVENIVQTCEDEGVDAQGMKHFAGLMGRAVQERGGDSGVAVVMNYFLK